MSGKDGNLKPKRFKLISAALTNEYCIILCFFYILLISLDILELDVLIFIFFIFSNNSNKNMNLLCFSLDTHARTQRNAS